MNDTDLRTALHDWAGESGAGRPPVADRIGRGRRRRRRQALTGLGGTAAAVLAVGAVAMSSLVMTSKGEDPTAATPKDPSVTQKDPGGPGATRDVQGNPEEPRLELAAAISESGGQSFRFVVESELTVRAHDLPPTTGTCSGMIDPDAGTGYMRSGELNEHWAVDGIRYQRMGKQRNTLGPGDVSRFIVCHVGRVDEPGFVAADPASLLRDLSGQATIQKINPSTYAFTGTDITGTVTVSDGLVSSLTSTVDSPARGDMPAYHRTVTMTLSGYGEPVQVRAPW